VSTQRRWEVGVWVVAAVFAVLFLAQYAAPDMALFTTVLTPRVVGAVAQVAKISAQATACVFAARCAAYYGKGSPVRPGWLLLAIAFGSYVPAQSVLALYESVLSRVAPVPSVGDPFFALGTVCLSIALLRFVAAYRQSGFPVGSLRDQVVFASVVTSVFAVAAYWLLMPIVLGPAPVAEKVVNLGYLVLDLFELGATLVLLRITIRFRGGRVWTVWAALLAGIFFAAGADVLFAELSGDTAQRLNGVMNLLYVLSYLFCAYGARQQYALLTD
jgi:hypothetical protein